MQSYLVSAAVPAAEIEVLLAADSPGCVSFPRSEPKASGEAHQA